MATDKKQALRYRKISLRIHADAAFRRLSPIPPCGRGLWLYLLTCPESTMIPGIVVGYAEGMARRLGWLPEAFHEAYAEAYAEGMTEADWDAGIVWIPKAIEHNPPQSVNVIKAWKNSWSEVPECELKSKAYYKLKAYTDGMSKGFRDAFAKSCPMPSGKAWRIQEQEKEKEPEQEQENIPGIADAQPDPRAPAGKPAKPRKPKSDKPPLPFRAEQAAKYVAETAGGRFLASNPGKHSIPIEKLIRQFPSPDQWRRLGRYLAAGGEGYATEPLGVRWLASSANVGEAMARAAAWTPGTPASAPQRQPSRSPYDRPEQTRPLPPLVD